MFNSLTKKIDKKIQTEYIEVNFTNKELINFYGDSFDSKQDNALSVASIRDEASKKISLIKLEIKKIKKGDKKLYKKVKNVELKNKKSEMNKNRLSFKTLSLEQKFTINNFKKMDTPEKFSRVLEKELFAEINETKKHYKKQVRQINYVGDSNEVKEDTMFDLFNKFNIKQKELSDKIVLIRKFQRREIDLIDFEKTPEGKIVLAGFFKLKNDNKKVLEDFDSKKLIAAENKKTKTFEIKKTSTENLKSEKSSQMDVIYKMYGQINNIKEQRDKKLLELKSIKAKVMESKSDVSKEKYQKALIKNNLIIEKSKSWSFVKTFTAYSTYLSKSAYFWTAKNVLFFTRQYKQGIPGKGLELRSELNKALAEGCKKGSWNEEYYLKLNKTFEKASTEFNKNEVKNFSKFEFYKVSNEDKKDFFAKNELLLDKELIKKYDEKFSTIFRNADKLVKEFNNEQKATKLSREKKTSIALKCVKNRSIVLSQAHINASKVLSDLFGFIKKNKVESKKANLLTPLEIFAYKKRLEIDKFSYSLRRWEANKLVRLQRKNKQVARMALHNSIRASRINYIDNISRCKYQNKLFSKKYDKKEARANLWVSLKSITKDANNKSEYINKYYPIEVSSGTRFILLVTNMVFGGVAYLFARQWKKGIIFMLITTFMYIFLLMFMTGSLGLGGNGLVGLGKLGLGADRPDSRFYLVEGVYSIFNLLILVMYVWINAFAGYRLGLLMEKGMRPNSWFISKKILDRVHLPYVLSIPAVLVVIFMTLVPLTVLLLIGFTDWGKSVDPKGGDVIGWVGFDNFKTLFSTGGQATDISREFGQVLGWTFIWGISTFILGQIVGVSITMLVNAERIKFTKFWKTVMILPMAIPGFIMILMFSLLVKPPSAVGNDNAGPIFKLLVDLHIWNGTIQTPIGPDTNNLMLNVTFVKVFLILLSLWFGIGRSMMFFSGLMQGISPTLYEAAEVDGAGTWKRQSTITIPHILFIIMPMLIPWFVSALNNYGLIWLFNGGYPQSTNISQSGVGQTDIIMSWIYKMVAGGKTFDNSFGIVSVIAVIFGAISIGVSLPGILKSKMFKEGDW